MNMMQRFLVSGKVQQVGYRDYAVRSARALGLTGWVRNLRDGRVEILAEGEPDALAEFSDACRQGPPLARVNQVEALAAEERHVLGFTKRFTADSPYAR
jgi:acylphosphatase